MSAPVVVVADTTPLNYLIQIGHAEILGDLFGQVLIPKAVLAELGHPGAPQAVTHWLQAPPAWLRVVPVLGLIEALDLGKGEAEAISLAVEQQVKLVLMDERKGRAVAESKGFLPVGTLTLLDLADERRLLDGCRALDALRQTNFRASAELMGRFEAKMSARRA